MLQFPPWKVWLVLLVCAFGVVFALPNVFPPAEVQQLPDWLPKRQVSLGLDLRGGSYLLYRVDMSSVVHDQLNNIVDALRDELLDRHVGYTGGLKIADDHIAFGLRYPDQIEDVRAAVRKVAPELQMTVSQDDEVTLAFSPASLTARTAVRSAVRSRSSAAALTRPASRNRRSSARATTGSSSSCRGSPTRNGSSS
jgi:preprotein translocase subunit SecD